MNDSNDRSYQVTSWMYPHEMLRTGWGTVSWSTYLKLEQERWASHGRDCEIRTENGEMALFASTGRGWMPKELGEEQQ